MTVAFDAVGPSSAGVASTSSNTLTWSHTCTGTNLAVLVGCALGISSDTGASLAATFGGVAMTSLGVVHTDNSTAGFVQLWVLAGPPTGASTVVVTKSGGFTPVSLVGGSVSLTGAHQATPVGTPATAFGSSAAASVALASTTAGNMVVDAVCGGSPIGTSGKTLRWEDNNNGSSGAGNAAQSTAAAGGTVTMSYALGADFWGIIAVEVLAASGGAPPVLVPPLVSQYGGFH